MDSTEFWQSLGIEILAELIVLLGTALFAPVLKLVSERTALPSPSVDLLLPRRDYILLLITGFLLAFGILVISRAVAQWPTALHWQVLAAIGLYVLWSLGITVFCHQLAVANQRQHRLPAAHEIYAGRQWLTQAWLLKTTFLLLWWAVVLVWPPPMPTITAAFVAALLMDCLFMWRALALLDRPARQS